MVPFNIDAAVSELCARDTRFAGAVTALGPCTFTLRRDRTPFEALLRTIVYQQLAGSAARVIHARVLEIAGHEGPDPAQVLRRRDATLAKAGLSRNKIAAVRDLARKCTTGEVPSFQRMKNMDDREIAECLQTIRGIGPWTVQMLLMFNLGRPDVLPVSDLGIRKGYKLIFGSRRLPSEKTLQHRGRRWRPWRTIASWYLWKAADGDAEW